MTKKTTILISFIGLKFLLQFLLLSSEYDLQRDEYLHLDQANHLAWGYLSVPPFTSWTSYIIQLLGNSIFWIKFFPALYGALTIYIVWKAIEELNGNLFALILGATCVLFSALMRLNTLYQPNSFDVLSWTVLYFILLKYIKSDDSKWLYIGATVFAIGFLNKYNIIFLLIGLVPSLLITEHRKVFFKPTLYFAISLGLVLILPNLIWQYDNNFPVLHHLKELAETQLVNVNKFDFLKNQLLFFIGSLIVIFASFYALLFFKPFYKYRLFFSSILFTLIAFIYFKAKDYYAIGIYPIYISFGSVYIADILKDGWRKYLQPVAIAIPLLLFIPIFNVAFPNKSPEYIVQHSEKYKKLGLLRWEDGKDHLLPQDFADMLGWKELAQKVDSIYLRLPNKNNTLILCDNYGQAGAINYYTSQKIQAVSFNADYIDWFDLNKKYENLIRVKEAEEINVELQETSPFFQNSTLADSITNQYAREFGTGIFLFTGAKIDIRQRIKDEIAEKKNYR
ncbi:glycosyltransferase family 39 protein [Flavobacterium capsici]|uniref:Glycosyltransferase family 39 protein n=1 Tax=Flavobacterium capsici TaxID=3075618 RepID=A0AA96F4Q5_9FLAO|nr:MULTISPECIES: glycosyltransferase family 39 protein [unclassified Flavobacterium]WNM18691.1 glycosyltransferase family 39 protein [Flavobacterium sp. PMR2A8]WNM22742.1 glycosyltransferase family 39 protein [Flavobacterium sp. PMTSA4]